MSPDRYTVIPSFHNFQDRLQIKRARSLWWLYILQQSAAEAGGVGLLAWLTGVPTRGARECMRVCLAEWREKWRSRRARGMEWGSVTRSYSRVWRRGEPRPQWMAAVCAPWRRRRQRVDRGLFLLLLCRPTVVIHTGHQRALKPRITSQLSPPPKGQHLWARGEQQLCEGRGPRGEWYRGEGGRRRGAGLLEGRGDYWGVKDGGGLWYGVRRAGVTRVGECRRGLFLSLIYTNRTSLQRRQVGMYTYRGRFAAVPWRCGGTVSTWKWGWAQCITRSIPASVILS